MEINKLADIEGGANDYDDAIKHLQSSGADDGLIQGKLAPDINALNSFDELHTLNATAIGTELGGSDHFLPEAQDVSLHVDIGLEHLDGLSGGEDASIAENLHIIDLSGG